MDDCHTAALPHDTGKVIMASALDGQYQGVLQQVRQRGVGLYEAEHFGCSHAEVGAYLFGLWGLPSHIVEAVAWHHTPLMSPGNSFSAIAAVHLGSICHEEANPYWMTDRTPVDDGFLSKIECLDREKIWRKSVFGADTGRQIQ